MDPRVKKIKQLMRDDVQRGWTLLELAQAVNLSVWRLSHIFVSEVGKSPIHYLRELRINRAKYLLETSFLSVKEIAHQVGMRDESHFIRDFKKAYGEPPTRHRLRSMREQINEAGNQNNSLAPAAEEAEKESEGRSAIHNQLAKAVKR
jgi:transcriptional regulator GlxA family with amidase domain